MGPLSIQRGRCTKHANSLIVLPVLFFLWFCTAVNFDQHSLLILINLIARCMKTRCFLKKHVSPQFCNLLHFIINKICQYCYSFRPQFITNTISVISFFLAFSLHRVLLSMLKILMVNPLAQ